VIVVAGPPLSLAAVARVLGKREKPCWLAVPAEEGTARAGFEFVASDPVEVVEGDSVDVLTESWGRAQAAWRGSGRPPSESPVPLPAAVPIGVGQLSYDLGRDWHGLPARAGSTWAPIEFRFYDALWVEAFGRAPEIWATDAAAAERLRARIEGKGDETSVVVATELAAEAATKIARDPEFVLSPFTSVEPPAAHEAAVAKILAYLRAGDAYQVNLARRLRARLQTRGPVGLNLFLRLREESPAPHALWLGDPGRQRALIGNSPERFLQLSRDGWLETAPIKGTRPRGGSAAEDDANAADLLATAKDRAEHVMIVDLERNDLGRVCEPGTVHVAELLRVMRLPSVFHLVSRVRGRLRAGIDLAAILRATFPGGSITGAPKRRAMEIIDELEPAPRGPYTGATGWLGAAGDFDLAVAIRTAALEGETLTLWVGGGIVIDSTPEGELAETDVKARAFAALATPPSA
jgi:para-aminobenzoate synthetase component 1